MSLTLCTLSCMYFIVLCDDDVCNMQVYTGVSRLGCMQVYTGVNRLGYIQPQTLARQDIVITSYETLRKEIDYVDLPHTNSQL